MWIERWTTQAENTDFMHTFVDTYLYSRQLNLKLTEFRMQIQNRAAVSVFGSSAYLLRPGWIEFTRYHFEVNRSGEIPIG